MLRSAASFMSRVPEARAGRGYVTILRTGRQRPAHLCPDLSVLPSCAGSTRLLATAQTVPSNKVLRAKARHIVVGTEEKADELLKRIEAGERFDDLAEFNSSCGTSKEGGETGWFTRQDLAPEFEEACFNNSPGSRVKAHTRWGWHIIEVLGHGEIRNELNVGELAEILADPEAKKMASLTKNGAPSYCLTVKGLCPHSLSQYQLIDVREPEEVQIASIRGTDYNLPFSERSRWGQLVLRDQLLDKQKKAIVFCHHGMRSAQAVAFLTSQGEMKDVYNLVGGIHAYSNQVDPSVPQY